MFPSPAGTLGMHHPHTRAISRLCEVHLFESFSTPLSLPWKSCGPSLHVLPPASAPFALLAQLLSKQRRTPQRREATSFKMNLRTFFSRETEDWWNLSPGAPCTGERSPECAGDASQMCLLVKQDVNVGLEVLLTVPGSSTPEEKLRKAERG